MQSYLSTLTTKVEATYIKYIRINLPKNITNLNLKNATNLYTENDKFSHTERH